MKFPLDRVLTDDFPRRTYKPSNLATTDNIVVKGLHYGQRKLLLSEIEFLSAYLETPRTTKQPLLVVYAGAANGSHLPFLFDLFKDVKFVLIDPAPFCAAVREIAQLSKGPIVELVEGYCTDELCLRLSRSYHLDYNILFISDIRSGEPKRQSNKENTAMIMRDNEMQRSWCWSLKANAALLKFHPPYPRCKDPNSRSYDENDNTPDSVEYMDGNRLFGIWAPKSSSELRLCVQGPFTTGTKIAMRIYDCSLHEEQCYFYNTSDRYTRDCEAEKNVLQRYLTLFPVAFSADVVKLSNAISEFLKFPLFRPLDPSFTEKDARWVTLLYSTRDSESLVLFDHLRGLVTLGVIQDLIKMWRDAKSVPENVTIGSVTLSREFWKVMCTGDLVGAYGLPRMRWGFAHEILSRKSGRSSNEWTAPQQKKMMKRNKK
ncbi:mRNA methyltransferase-like [Trypanosoma melophagium]|uniref:mRNA methyltransferase-like n=1 Tax=Trypanosoma melophagium TaxID=715481 RepID=UPI00351A4FA5|nr:mRNA methyltransferase-like [Trypanosoma melophagium]